MIDYFLQSLSIGIGIYLCVVMLALTGLSLEAAHSVLVRLIHRLRRSL